MNIGDYVRLNNCVYDIVVINRIAEIYEDTILTENDGSMYQGEYTKEEIIKSSPNIIDLIEVGDYVNGSKVVDIAHAPTKTIYTEQKEACELIPITKDKLKSILTKEQFEAIKYEIK